MAQQITAWSPSRLATYEECPRRAKYKYIDKLPDRNSPAMARGIAIHESADAYIRWQIKSLAPSLLPVKKLITELRNEYKQRLVRTELDVAVDRNWTPCDWMDPKVYLRVKVDVIRLTEDKSTCQVIDWKTGKFKPVDSKLGAAYDDALNLYACVALALGFARQASACLVFTDEGKTVSRPKGTVSLSVLGREQRRWAQRVKPLLNDTIFEAKPGDQCRWCVYSCNKGGPCEF